MLGSENLHTCSFFVCECSDFLPCLDTRSSLKCCLQDTIWCVVVSFLGFLRNAWNRIYLHKCSYFIRGCKHFLPCFDFRNSFKRCLQCTIWCVVNDFQQCLQISNFSKPVSKINENVIFFLSINSTIANFWCELKACKLPNFHDKRVKIF